MVEQGVAWHSSLFEMHGRYVTVPKSRSSHLRKAPLPRVSQDGPIETQEGGNQRVICLCGGDTDECKCHLYHNHPLPPPPGSKQIPGRRCVSVARPMPGGWGGDWSGDIQDRRAPRNPLSTLCSTCTDPGENICAGNAGKGLSKTQSSFHREGEWRTGTEASAGGGAVHCAQPQPGHRHCNSAPPPKTHTFGGEVLQTGTKRGSVYISRVNG